MKFAVSPVASHSGCRTEVTNVLMGLQVMLESGPVEGLLGEKAAERREPQSDPNGTGKPYFDDVDNHFRFIHFSFMCSILKEIRTDSRFFPCL